MLMKVLFFINLVFVFAQGCTHRGMECPDYTLLEKHFEYEVRMYPELTWAVTNEVNRLGMAAERKAFNRLTEYFEGKNNKSMDIPKTLPVRTKFSHYNKQNFEVSFLMPTRLSKNPPFPTDMRVKIVQEPPTVYIVRAFSGYYSEIAGVPEKTWDQQAKKLAEIVKDDDSVQKTSYYRIQYDIPSLFVASNNEIWMTRVGVE